MSDLKMKDLHQPFNTLSIEKFLGHVFKGVNEQAVAASGTSAMPRLSPVPQDLSVQSVYAMVTHVPGTGESMVVDVQVDGTSILSSTTTIDSTYAAKTQIPLALDPAKTMLARGAKVTVVRTYTAGGAAALTDNAVYIEPRPS